jgi:hypothetical protein
MINTDKLQIGDICIHRYYGARYLIVDRGLVTFKLLVLYKWPSDADPEKMPANHKVISDYEIGEVITGTRTWAEAFLKKALGPPRGS